MQCIQNHDLERARKYIDGITTDDGRAEMRAFIAGVDQDPIASPDRDSARVQDLKYPSQNQLMHVLMVFTANKGKWPVSESELRTFCDSRSGVNMPRDIVGVRFGAQSTDDQLVVIYVYTCSAPSALATNRFVLRRTRR